MKKLILLLTLIFFIETGYSQDFYVTSTGKTYSEARSSISRLITSQGLKIVGQNHCRNNDGSWVLIIKARNKNY